MRKSHPITGNRPLRAGIATAATAALAVAGIASPAYAVAVDGTLSTAAAPLGGGVNVTLTATGAFPANLVAATVGGRFIASTATCDQTYGTTSSAKPAAAVVIPGSQIDDATITVPALAAGQWKACVYGATTGTAIGTSTPLIATSGANTITVSGANTVPALSPSAGTSAGGTVVTATRSGTWLSTGGSTLGVIYRSSGSCASAYTTTGSAATGTATKNSGNTVATFTIPTTLPSAGNYTVCVYAGTGATSGLIGVASYGALPTSTVSPSAGNSGGGNTIILTTKTAAITTSTPGALFTKSDACPADVDSAGADDEVATITRISTSKAAVEVPAGVTHSGTGNTTDWKVCVYGSASTGKLLAVPAIYSVAELLDLTNVTIDPANGPSQGGSAIEVTISAGLPDPGSEATMSAKLGNSPLKDIVIVDDDTFTATTTAASAGAAKLSVSTAAGQQTSAATEFTFSYGITVTPNTAKYEDTDVTLDILGSGFDALNFAATAEAGASTAPGAGVGVFLVTNSWYGLVAGATIKQVGLTAQCMDVTKISDTELICTLDLTKRLKTSDYFYETGSIPRGVYNVALVNDASATTANAVDTNISRISSGSAFTVADY
ncbi:hypothetical protein [Paractinoplanes atraurantiacus]|uniref:IPT/TIG domain-containing protein n=1 Tax=Paractinoplanes atraurantiacus TaxID=1036182 RepID=A0A285JZQ2_9ACTN|nr:hypothetical protein [Actinoplanes atraurantiacus]SNY65738.1 hypothetical protein SAMN05421748_128118 [Actinoplanes atraurantiacus]